MIRPASAFTTAVNHALEQAREAQATRQAEIAKEESEQRATLLRLEEEAAARRTSLVAADAQQRDAARAITEIEEGRAAARFIAERAGSADYQRHLGLISMIQRDLAKLSNLMRPPESAEKPSKRDESLPQIDRTSSTSTTWIAVRRTWSSKYSRPCTYYWRMNSSSWSSASIPAGCSARSAITTPRCSAPKEP